MKHEDGTTLEELGSLRNARRRVSRNIGLALCFAILAGSTLRAQTTTGSVVGVVTDPTNAAISSAAVSLTNTQTSDQRTAESDATGAYQFLNVPPGEYELGVFHERATETTLKGLVRRIAVEDGALVLPNLDISEAGYLPIPHKNKYGHDYPPETDDNAVYPAVRR